MKITNCENVTFIQWIKTLAHVHEEIQLCNAIVDFFSLPQISEILNINNFTYTWCVYYRNEIEKVKKSLERDNMIAMESMKNKMREMAKAHSTAMSALSRQYKDEIDEIRDRSAEKHLSDTEVQVRPYLKYLSETEVQV